MAVKKYYLSKKTLLNFKPKVKGSYDAEKLRTSFAHPSDRFDLQNYIEDVVDDMTPGVVKVAKATYDFSVDGTASGDVPLAITQSIPDGAFIKSVTTNETTPLTGSTDIDIQVGTTAVVVAEDFTASSGVTEQTIATNVVATGGNISLHNDGSAITAGVVDIYIEYYA